MSSVPIYEMRIPRSNKETLQFLKQIDWKKIALRLLSIKLHAFLVLSSQKGRKLFNQILPIFRGREPSLSFKLEDVTPKNMFTEEDSVLNCEQDLITKSLFPSKNNVGIFGENTIVFSTHVWLFANMFRTSQTCVLTTTHVHFGKCLTFTHHVWKTQNTLVNLHLGAFFRTCLDFDKYVWEKAHMCEKSHTIILLQMFGIFHTCVEKATGLLISP